VLRSVEHKNDLKLEDPKIRAHQVALIGKYMEAWNRTMSECLHIDTRREYSSTTAALLEGMKHG
jgi:hypothetical protein